MSHCKLFVSPWCGVNVTSQGLFHRVTRFSLQEVPFHTAVVWHHCNRISHRNCIVSIGYLRTQFCLLTLWRSLEVHGASKHCKVWVLKAAFLLLTAHTRALQPAPEKTRKHEQPKCPSVRNLASQKIAIAEKSLRFQIAKY